jgi:formiminotetrahydrofolate cyclodeaminase
MALRISQKKAARDLARPTEAALQLQASLLACADRDRQAFSAYLAASKLPGPERGPALRAAALGAAQVPLQAARQMTLALWVARQSAGLIHPAVSSDAEGAKYLLAGAGRAVLCNVEINLGPLDQQIAAQLRSEQQRLGDLIERLGR